MKRIAASLLCLTLITGAFASCSSKDSSSGSSAAQSAESAVNDAVGKWDMGNGTTLVVGSDNKLSAEGTKSISSFFTFDSDGSCNINGQKVTAGSFDYDGTRYRLHIDSDDDLTMERKVPNDGTEFYGTYYLVSGSLFDAVKTGYNNRAAETGSDEKFDDGLISLELEIGENKTDLLFSYTVGELSPDGTVTMELDGNKLSGKYEVSGDTLIITPDNGNKKELSRIK